jgi:hypothetical protein
VTCFPWTGGRNWKWFKDIKCEDVKMWTGLNRLGIDCSEGTYRHGIAYLSFIQRGKLTTRAAFRFWKKDSAPYSQVRLEEQLTNQRNNQPCNLSVNLGANFHSLIWEEGEEGEKDRIHTHTNHERETQVVCQRPSVGCNMIGTALTLPLQSHF